MTTKELLAPTVLMVEGARFLADAAALMLVADPKDAAAWERCVSDATAGLARVVALQTMWEQLLGDKP